MYTNGAVRGNIAPNNTKLSEQTCDHNGCQAQIGDKICGETDTLEITREFRQLYEDKLKEIDSVGGGDCVQAKISLQQDWIRDLTEQNEMLIRAIEELEVEATERVQMLEDKLKKSAVSGLEVMKKYNELDMTINLKGTLQKIMYLENDLSNLLEFIRRIREEGTWNTDGLSFHEISSSDLYGKNGQFGPDPYSKMANEKVSKYLRVSFEVVRNEDGTICCPQKALCCDCPKKSICE